MSEEEFLEQFIKNNPFDFKQGIINHCRQLDKLDVYEWVAEDELKIQKLQQENQRLKESYCNRTDCSGRLHDSRKYPSVKQQLDLYKSVLDEIRKIIQTEKRLMGYATYDSCLLLIEEQLDKVK